MERSTFDDAMSWLKKFNEKDISEAVAEHYWKQFKNVEDAIFCDAVNLICEGSAPASGHFSTIQQIRQNLIDVQNARWQKEKRSAPTYDDLRGKAGTTSHGKETFKLISDLYDGKISRQQYLEKMYAMEEKYPGFGWKQGADDLKRFWDSEPERTKDSIEVLARIERGRDQRELNRLHSERVEEFKKRNEQ